MTTIPENSREWLTQKAQGNEPDDIDTIALGTGNGESDTATELEDEVHRAHISNSDVTFPELEVPGAFEAVINVTGGDEVPDLTEITEIGVFAGGDDGGDVLVAIDEFGRVTVDQGHTEEFTMPIRISDVSGQ